MGFTGVALSRHGIRRATLFKPSASAVHDELARYGASTPETGSRATEIEALLVDYADGKGASLDCYPVDVTEGTAMQREVWDSLRSIPRGETRSYAWLTRKLGRPPGAA